MIKLPEDVEFFQTFDGRRIFPTDIYGNNDIKTKYYCWLIFAKNPAHCSYIRLDFNDIKEFEIEVNNAIVRYSFKEDL